MTKKIFLLLCFFIFLFSATNIYSSVLKVSVNKREVEINETLFLTIEVDKNIKDINLPKISDFIVILRDVYNGKKVNIYKYEMVPKTIGFFSIPSIIVESESSAPISIKVFKTEDKNFSLQKDSSSLAEAFTDTRVVYVNQLVYYTLSFKTKRDLASNPSYTLPIFQDFWKSKSNVKSGYKLINGENYFTFDVCTSLYPMRDGNLVISPSKVSIEYLNSNTIKNFETKKIKLKVLPLPNLNKPEFFSGAVGKYEISAVVNKKILKVNEPFNLIITIKGNGNINSILEPDIKLPNEMKRYATTINIDKRDIIKTKQFQCVIIPIIEGNYIIPKISFSYFNPDLKDYIIISTKEIKIKVLGKKQKDTNTDDIKDGVDNSNNEGTINLINTINIKDNVNLSNCSNANLITDRTFLLLVVLILLLVMVSIFYRIRLMFLYKDVVKKQKIVARKNFFKCMNKSKMYLNNAKKFEFFFYIDVALKMLLKSKNNYGYYSMTKNDIAQNLMALNFDTKLINSVINILNICDKFKFTPNMLSKDEMVKIYTQVNFIKEQLDKMAL